MEKQSKINQIGQLLQKTTDIQDYSHIELTEEEKQKALRLARMSKARQIEIDEEAEKRRQQVLNIQSPWTTDELTAYVLDKAKRLPFRFEIDESNKEVFELLCLYFSNNPEFEKKGFSWKDKDGAPGGFIPYSFKKGICLQSHTRGTGKTVLMELFGQNKKNCYVIVSTSKIASFFEANGDDIISRYSRPWDAEKEPRFFYHSPIGICFDDLGDEEIKVHYGNKLNVMQRILTRIYSENPEKNLFPFFHITTNLTGNAIEEMYDKRVRSRMREMFNWIELPGQDRRK